MAGAIIGGAVYHMPIVLDGVISLVAALVAERLLPNVRDFLIPSHRSKEPAAEKISEKLRLDPVIDAKMAVGEGNRCCHDADTFKAGSTCISELQFL